MLNPIPNARSGDPYSFFWNYVESGVHYTCATQGGAWVARLRLTLGLPVSDVWDADVQNALIQQASQFAATDSAWAPIVQQLTTDLSTQILSLLSAKFGLFITYYRPAGKRFDLIGLAPTAVLPAWGVSPDPFDPAGWGQHTPDELICFVPGTDPPPPLSMTETATAMQESQQGVRAGRSSPGGINIIPGAGAGLNGLALAGLGIVFFAGVWWLYKKSTGPNR